MKASINIGDAEHAPETVTKTAAAIGRVLDVAHLTNMDQETVRKALDTLGKAVSVQGVTITGSHFQGDKVVHMDPPE